MRARAGRPAELAARGGPPCRLSGSRASTSARPPRRLEEEVERGILLTTLDRAVGWARKQSMWPATFGLACCAIEMMSTGAGQLRPLPVGHGAVPRLAAAGRPDDRGRSGLAEDGAGAAAGSTTRCPSRSGSSRWACAPRRGGMFTNYAIVQGVDTIVPVDVYVPGCPPKPEMLMHGILTLQREGPDRRGTSSERQRAP